MSLYMWGTNTSRQLIGQSTHVLSSPSQGIDKLLENQVPLQVAAGYEHSLVLTESGDVFSYGSGKPHFGGRGTGIKVQGLDHETIVTVAAGAHSSYAVSNTGKVYHWGLIHEDVNPDVGGESAAATATADNDAPSGALTGLAQDQTTVVTIDAEARSSTNRSNGRANRARQLREIVQDSTEQWMLPTGDVEREYYEELRSMGYAVEEAEERMQERGREYHGMIRMGCKRVPQPIPRLVPNLNGIRIVSVSAGYAHVMLISEKGLLYGAGYNDRGQLGLGHRINTSVFKLVDFLTTKFVVQVTCGQQHTLCRAIDRSVADSAVTVGASILCDVFAWGNGMLGQLGLGMKGTSKGRLFPTPIPFFQEHFPSGIMSVAAGANFSTVVVSTGEVYSFGHSEYNQHGTGNTANRDYVDPYYFFVPRKVQITDPAKAAPVRIRSVTSGLMFTVATSEDGDLYSWGWNEGGVLGHGVNYYSASPHRIEKIGHHSDRGYIAQVVCGAKHVLAIRHDPGATWTQSYQSILKELPYSDLVITLDAPVYNQPTSLAQAMKTNAAAQVETSFRCHRVIVSARCRYLRGIIDASSYDQGQESDRSDYHNNSVGSVSEELMQAVTVPAVTNIHLSGSHFNAVTMRALLEYFYINRVHIALHKRREFLLVAQELMLADLENAIMADITADRNLREETINQFEQHIEELCGAKQNADLVFVVQKANKESTAMVNDLSNNTDSMAQQSSVFRAEDYEQYHFGHKIIVQKIPYFEAFMESNFKESTIYTYVLKQDALQHTMKQRVQVIDMTFLVNDGVDFGCFQKVLMYAYTGRLQKLTDEIQGLEADNNTDDSPDASAAATTAATSRGTESGNKRNLTIEEIMQLLSVANRLGYNPLAQYCERQLSLAIAFCVPDEVFHCYEFAQYYNLPRLEMQCLAVLRHVGYDIPATGDEEENADEDEGSEAHCP